MQKTLVFIEQAKQIHGEKYNYDKVVYKSQKAKVIIKCNDCQEEFFQAPRIHLTSKNCVCQKRIDFIKEATETYGNRYNYDKVAVFINKHTDKVTITCNECNEEFRQTPAGHLIYDGCDFCRKKNVLLQREQEFLTAAKEKYGDNFNYDQCIFVDSKTYVIIKCNTCGTEFPQTPNRHLLKECKGGCPKCMINNMKIASSNTTEDFISKSIQIYGDKYDYSASNYIDAFEHVSIRCIEHDVVFEQAPRNHYIYEGCHKCVRKNRMKTQEEFIRDAKKIHGDRFDYSKAVYNGVNEKVIIRCIKHDYEFPQIANAHTSYEQGCSKCAHEELAILNTLTNDEFIGNCKKRYGDKFNYDKTNYSRYDSKITVTCNNCHNDSTPIARHHYAYGACLHCAPVSKCEVIISTILTKYNINFKEQFRLENDIRRYDFLLTDLNVIIEFDGQQHVFFVPHWHRTIEKFLENQQVDADKTVKALNNKYKMIRIDFNINTEEYLEKYIFSALKQIDQHDLILSSDLYDYLLDRIETKPNYIIHTMEAALKD